MTRPLSWSRARVLRIGAWTLVAVLAALLIVLRFRDALATDPLRDDLGTFLFAERSLVSGGDVYAPRTPVFNNNWYTYSPFIAWMLVPIAESPWLVHIWTALELALGVAAIGAVLAVLWSRLGGLQCPLVAGIAVFTLFYSQPLALELALGQTQLALLATTAFAVLADLRRRPFVAGALLALGGIIKSWPAAFALWLVRSGAAGRWRAIAGAASALALLLVIMLTTLGPASIGEWVQRTLFLSEQTIGTFSVWVFARELFTPGTVPVPLADAPLPGLLVSGAAALVVLAILVYVLCRPGDAGTAMWNVVGCVIVLLPVSHINYRILMLPLLWIWAARLLESRSFRARALAPLAAAVVWWFVTFRLLSVGVVWHSVAVVVTTIALLALSAWAAAADRQPALQTADPVAEAVAR